MSTRLNDIANELDTLGWELARYGGSDHPVLPEVARALHIAARRVRAVDHDHAPGTGCPGCDATLASLRPGERARLPLRRAAHAYAEACDRHLEVVRVHGHAGARDMELMVEQADEEMATAALAYAKTRSVLP
jgi:hypothetical protein